MRTSCLRIPALLGTWFVSLAAAGQPPLNGGDFSQGPQTQKVPADVILVKGAWSGASDTGTPDPEGGKVTAESYDNAYFGLKLTLPTGWIQKYEGPPPSDGGYYVLAQLRPAEILPGRARGTLLVTAQDLFFSPTRAAGPLELINYTREHLQADYRVERPPTSVTLAGRNFVELSYGSAVSGLHWSVFATQIRCHVVEFIFTSRDTHLLETLTHSLDALKSASGDTPVCVKDYATAENIVERVDPVFAEHRYNAIPVRVIIDREGKVKHIHYLSAFPSQAQAITAAVSQWRFKPYLRNGRPVEIETGILFGRAPRGAL
jgi:Gram-negative bacterial TonB protein C-terminal